MLRHAQPGQATERLPERLPQDVRVSPHPQYPVGVGWGYPAKGAEEDELVNPRPQ